MNKERIVESYESFQQINESSYWDERGKYQEEYKKLYDELVPDQGAAETVKGELLRAVSRLYYEAFNNGNGNAVIEHWNEEDEEYGGHAGYGAEYEVNSFYQEFLDFIESHIPQAKNICSEIHYIIKESGWKPWEDIRHEAYDDLTNIVMEFILDENNKETLEKEYVK
jgi:hypothetical protein